MLKLIEWWSVPFRSIDESSALNENCDIHGGVCIASMADISLIAREFPFFYGVKQNKTWLETSRSQVTCCFSF